MKEKEMFHMGSILESNGAGSGLNSVVLTCNECGWLTECVKLRTTFGTYSGRLVDDGQLLAVRHC